MMGALKEGSVVQRRTGMTFAYGDTTVPHGHPLLITDVMPGGSAYYEDLEMLNVGHIPGRYADTDHFIVLVMAKPDGPSFNYWMAGVRDLTDGEITCHHLEPNLTEFGFPISDEVLAWWLELLNDREVPIEWIAKRLRQLCDLYVHPPTMAGEFDDWMEALGEEALCALLMGHPAKLWRRTQIAIGRVLLQGSDRHSELVCDAARTGLRLLRPTAPLVPPPA